MIRRHGLSPEDAALWRKVASTVTPLTGSPCRGDDPSTGADTKPGSTEAPLPAIHPQDRLIANERVVKAGAGGVRPAERHGLDAGWERKLARGLVDPDFTLDLHGATLDAAYARLGHGLQQARTMGARVVLLITGRPRPVEAADRGRMRGAIRAKVGDWIAASEHGTAIAAIRTAHRRHGGPGALYLIMRRRRT